MFNAVNVKRCRLVWATVRLRCGVSSSLYVKIKFVALGYVSHYIVLLVTLL